MFVNVLLVVLAEFGSVVAVVCSLRLATWVLMLGVVGWGMGSKVN